MSSNTILLLGASSDIAMAVAHRFARAGYDVQLAARNTENLIDDKSNLELRYDISVSLHEYDVLEINSHEALLEELPCLPTVAVCAVGYMGNQLKSEKNIEAASLVMRSNYEGPASVLSALANKFEERGSGCLVGISSVAGERGRSANYVYGSAKAGFTAFLSGLRNRLAKKGVHVITVLPGFVATKMTENIITPKFLTANTDEMGEIIFKSVLKKKDIVYYRYIWRWIMVIICNVPEFIFKKTNI